MSRATIITDASFCHRTKAAGWAAWIAADEFPKIREFGPFKKPPKTSSEAEIQAALNGLFLAYRAGARLLLIQSDCLGVGHMIDNRTKKFLNFQKLHLANSKVEYRHVKGHTNNPASRSWVNRWCDEQAKKAMRAQRDG